MCVADFMAFRPLVVVVETLKNTRQPHDGTRGKDILRQSIMLRYSFND